MAKRFTALLISIFLTTTLLTPSTQAAGTKIAIAYEAGGKGDNGINDLASLGLERAIKRTISPALMLESRSPMAH